VRLVILIVAVTVVVGACGGTSDKETTSTEPTEASGSVGGTSSVEDADLIQIAMETIDAWNTSVEAFQIRFATTRRF
jgi:hypothetical protein